MTLGQRIQECRKKLNLSQEALGEAMGVSRQAISKWESDLTIPEIDKLIALSKLFGLSVGQLLGVEEPVADEGADRALEMARAIAEGYLAQEEAGRKRRERRSLLFACAAGVVLTAVLAAVFLSVNSRLDRLNGRISGVEGQVNQINSNVSMQIDAVTQQVRESLEQQASLVEGFDYTLDRVLHGGASEITVTVVPRTYEAGMTALLSLTPEGGEPIMAEGEWDGMAFRFPAVLPAAPGDLAVSLALIDPEGSQQTQSLASIADLSRRTRLDLRVQVDGSSYTRSTGEGKNWHGRYLVNWEADYAQVEDSLDLSAERFQLRLVKNEEVVQRWDVPVQELPNSMKYVGDTLWEEDIPLEQEGDAYTLIYWMEDSVGQIYEGEIAAFEVEQGSRGLEAKSQPISAPAADW